MIHRHKILNNVEISFTLHQNWFNYFSDDFGFFDWIDGHTNRCMINTYNFVYLFKESIQLSNEEWVEQTDWKIDDFHLMISKV